MREKQNSRDSIVETAAELFARQGYHGTGLNQIIKESHCPKGSLYYYFPEGKEELAIECVNRTRKFVIDKWDRLFVQADHPSDAIQRFVDGLAKEALPSNFEGFFPFSFWMAAEATSISEKLRCACQEVLDSWLQVISQQLQSHGISKDQADEVASIVISSTEGALLLAQTSKDVTPILHAAKYIRLLMNSIFHQT